VLQDDHATTHTSIEDALSHRSGLPRHDLSWGELDGTPSSVVKSLRYLPMTAEPRTTFQYCNIMYAVVTDLLEKLTGLKLETILHDKIWGPLGMASTSFGGLDAQSNLARGYYWNAEQDDSSVTEGRSSSESYYVPEPHLNLSDISGAGATISSVNDYALWIKAFLDTASTTKPRNASSPINPALYRDVLTPRTIMQLLFGDTSPSEFLTPPLYALGWFILSIDGHKIVGHGGGLPGFGTTIWFLPDDGYGVVAMGNTAGTSNIVGSIIAQVLLKQKLGLSIKQSLSAEAGLHAAFSDPHLRQDTHQRNRNHSSEPHTRRPDISQPSRPPAKVAKLPLPGDISDYAGIYVHPAYGMINFTVFMTQCHHSRQDTVEAHSSSTYLYGIHSPKRILSYALEFHHVTDTLFTSELYLPHGMDSEIIWEHESSSRAIFKFGLTGEEVETLGIELDEEMVEAARRKGEKYWKEGMIWFEKVE
jgi:CubicO group peptidase (beta-lactamase class C family)